MENNISTNQYLIEMLLRLLEEQYKVAQQLYYTGDLKEVIDPHLAWRIESDWQSFCQEKGISPRGS